MDLLTLIEEHNQMKRELQLLREKMALVESHPMALEWLPETQACQFLHRSRGTVREYARQRKIRSEKRGGRVLYHVESMRAFLLNLNFSPQHIDQSLRASKPAA